MDKKAHLFACAATGTPAASKVESKPEAKAEEKSKAKVVEETKDQPAASQSSTGKYFKDEIVSQLSKLMNIYTAAGDRGKQMGYRRAISNIKAYAKPITDAD